VNSTPFTSISFTIKLQLQFFLHPVLGLIIAASAPDTLFANQQSYNWPDTLDDMYLYLGVTVESDVTLLLPLPNLKEATTIGNYTVKLKRSLIFFSNHSD
jgi:hypothetical protein